MNLKACLRTVFLVVLTYVLGFAACGGGGGSDSNSSTALLTNIRGSFTTNFSLAPVARGTNAIPGVLVSALGRSSTTDANGEWGFEVPTDEATGVDIAFTFSGGGFSSMEIVPKVPEGTSLVDIEFVSDSDRMISLDQVIADGTLVFDGSTTETDGTNTSTLDPKDPCSVLRNTNVTFVEVTEAIVTPDRPADTLQSFCGQSIERFVAIGNPQLVAFDYQITVNPSFVLITEPSGTLLPGEIVVVEAVRVCGEGGLTDSSLYDFTPEEGENPNDVQGDASLVVTVDVVSLAPEGGEVLSASEAVDACGSAAPVGNLTEQVEVPVTFDSRPF